MKTLLCLMALLVVCSLPAHGANPFRAAELSDMELSQLRGRYVMPDRIMHFGVTMSSVWENGAGQTVGAAVTFNVNGRAEPSLHVTDLSSQSPGTEGAVSPGTGTVVGGAGLTDVRGISQSVRSAGDFNNGLNNLEIVVSRGGEADVPAGGSTPWTGSTGFANEVGRVLIDRQGGGLKVMLDAGTQGSAMQQIGTGKVVQQASFTGDLNSVRNLATLSIGLKELPLGQDFANCTLEQLRALRPVGF